ncbi:hypothetical protein [Pseudomonas entomophila]|uniref:hypothetical protein n=1 Tax=Pseudomonas entomophila TaxID=312306 RepID=UPI003EBA6BC4
MEGISDRGETYQEEVALLEGTGQFDGRSFIDWSDDQFGAYGNAVQKIGAARDTAVGLAGGAGEYSGMIATSPACVGIVTCTVPAALGTLGTLSLQDAWESAKGITADFQSSEPQRVADSFQLGTFPGDESATTELLKDAAIVGAGATALRAAERTYRRVAAGVTGGAKGTGAVSSGAENAALYPKLKDQLIQENLSNIAAQDSRLAAAVSGSGTRNPNFSIGTGSAAEADSLGQIWVGDGARPISGVPGGLISADGARVYRPPTAKPNTPAQYNPTEVQANFQTLQDGKIIGNGHLSVTN